MKDVPQSGFTIETPSTHMTLFHHPKISKEHTPSKDSQAAQVMRRQSAQQSKNNSIVQTLRNDDDDDKEDTVEWNEGDELEQTDEDQAVVIRWILNENITE
ncbi:hypothetical protein M9458_021099, partial [Cirrhinus mrigala]